MAMYFQQLFFHSTIECFTCLNCGAQRDPKIIKPRLFILKIHLANSTFRVLKTLLGFWLMTVYLDFTMHSNVLYMCQCAFKFLEFYLGEILETKVEVNFSRYNFYLLLPAAKSLQSCPTLCDPIDRSPPGSPIPGILQARTLEWVAISFSNAWKWKVKEKLLSRVRLLATP